MTVSRWLTPKEVKARRRAHIGLHQYLNTRYQPTIKHRYPGGLARVDIDGLHPKDDRRLHVAVSAMTEARDIEDVEREAMEKYLKLLA